MSLDPNRLILTGENPFIRLSDTDGDMNLAPQRLLAKVAAEESGLGCLAELSQSVVGRVLSAPTGDLAKSMSSVSATPRA